MIFRDPWKLRIYVRPGRTDMRKAINGLPGIIRESFPIDPCEEALFVFCGRSRKLIKLLYRDGNGFCLWQKRLATGSFPWPDDGSQAMQLTTEEIQWLLSGVDFRRKHKIAFFERTG